MDPQYTIVGIGITLFGFFIYIVSHYAMKGQTYEEALNAQKKLNQIELVSRKEQNKFKDKKEKSKKAIKKEKLKELIEPENTKNENKVESKLEIKDESKEESKIECKIESKIKNKIKSKIQNKVENKVEIKTIKQDTKNNNQPLSNIKNEKIEKKKILNNNAIYDQFNDLNESKKNNDNFLNTNTLIFEKTDIENSEKINNDIIFPKSSSIIENKKQKITSKQDKKSVKIDKQIKNEKINLESNFNNTIQSIIENKLSTSTSSQLNLEFDISVTKLVEFLKVVPLSNEETQFIIDALLSKNSEGSSDWINKNDPITVLKKQLEEKEIELKVEIENHERSKARIILMRDEINQEKQKHANYKDQINFLNQKNLQTEAKLQKIDEIKSEEINKLKVNINKLQIKLSEEHNVALLKLNEEQAHTQQALNQLEKEKSKQNLFNFKLMQLDNEKQQLDDMNANLKKLNKELKKENLTLNEHISQIKNESKINEFNYKKQLNEKEENYKAMIVKLEEKSKELNSNVLNTAQLQNKLENLANENEKLFSDLKTVKQSLQVFKNEKQILHNLLNELALSGNKIENSTNVELLKEFIQKYTDLTDQLSNSKEEINKLIEKLEEEKLKNTALNKKVLHYESTLSNTENDLIEITNTTDKTLRDLNLRIESNEKTFYNLVSGNEKLQDNLGNQNEIDNKL